MARAVEAAGKSDRSSVAEHSVAQRATCEQVVERSQAELAGVGEIVDVRDSSPFTVEDQQVAYEPGGGGISLLAEERAGWTVCNGWMNSDVILGGPVSITIAQGAAWLLAGGGPVVSRATPLSAGDGVAQCGGDEGGPSCVVAVRVGGDLIIVSISDNVPEITESVARSVASLLQ